MSKVTLDVDNNDFIIVSTIGDNGNVKATGKISSAENLINLLYSAMSVVEQAARINDDQNMLVSIRKVQDSWAADHQLLAAMGKHELVDNDATLDMTEKSKSNPVPFVFPEDKTRN